MDSLYILNGGITASLSSSDVVRNKVGYSLRSSTEYSATNAWNMRFSDGNVNNNNNNNYKFYSYEVRAVAALGSREKISWLEAFEDCCRHKFSSKDCIAYRTIFYADLWRLMYEVHSRIYIPTTSSCFIVTRPKPREIFAASFRDRIVLHWIMLRIRALFEERFIQCGNVSFNCRKGFGTLLAVKTLQTKIITVTNNYQDRAYIGKFDIKSFFMSIRKDTVLELLLPFIYKNYKGEDIELLIYLVKVVISHCPLLDCIRKSSEDKWNLLPEYKSLFNLGNNFGLAIGNITSLEVANFFMSFLDEWILGKCSAEGAEYIRFVDDFIVISKSKQLILNIRGELPVWLWRNLKLALHEDKFYLLETLKGVKFIGSVIKPGRVYTSNTTIGRVYDKIIETESCCKSVVVNPTEYNLYKLNKEVCSLNSYMGFLVHNATYGFRRKTFSRLIFFWKCCYIEGKFLVIKIKRKYNYKEFLFKKVEEYELDLYRHNALDGIS